MKRVLTALGRHRRATTIAALCVVFIVLFSQGLVATVLPIGGSTAGDSLPKSGLNFDPTAYVKRIWPTQVVPAAQKSSISLATFLTAMKQDKAAALQKYGHKVADSYNLLVQCTGTIEKIDTSSPIGTVTLEVANGSGTVPVNVAIGPVILGTTLRDALTFISFGEFLNQIQYGDVADQLNSVVIDKVVTPLHLDQLKGKRVTVSGAYTYDEANPDDITITPVLFSIDKGAS